MTDFDKWDKEYRRQNMSVINNNPQGLLWLKVRAVSRSKQINKFAEDNGLKFANRRIAEQSIELFDILKYRPDAQCRLDKFLQNINHYCPLKMDGVKNQINSVHLNHREH